VKPFGYFDFTPFDPFSYAQGRQYQSFDFAQDRLRSISRGSRSQSPVVRD
jgi:hypothetical protein